MLKSLKSVKSVIYNFTVYLSLYGYSFYIILLYIAKINKFISINV